MEWRRNDGDRLRFRGGGRGRGRTAARRAGISSTPSSFSSSGSHSETWRSSTRRADPPSVDRQRDGGVGVSHRDGTDEGDRGSSEGFRAFVGTCPDMCPAKERIQRERLRDLSLFERLDGNPGRTSPGLAVKKFCRTVNSMHVQTSEVRPLLVLQETLRYLFKLLHCSDNPFEVVHDFVFDRTRSIRQDLSMQRINNDEAINMYEEMVTFHIVSHQKLLRCSDNSTVSSLVHLNMEQLMKVLMSLYDMYSAKQRSKEISKKEAEFYSFYVLLHLGHNNHEMGNSLSLWFKNLALPIFHSKEICFARDALRYFQMGNYVRFFRILATEASYFQLCLVEPIVNEVRAKALLYINSSGHKLYPYQLIHFSELLMLKESDLELICNLCGLKTIKDEACGKLLPTKQIGYCLPNQGFPRFTFVGSKRLQRWQVIINGTGNLFDENILE